MQRKLALIIFLLLTCITLSKAAELDEIEVVEGDLLAFGSVTKDWVVYVNDVDIEDEKIEFLVYYDNVKVSDCDEVKLDIGEFYDTTDEFTDEDLVCDVYTPVLKLHPAFLTYEAGNKSVKIQYDSRNPPTKYNKIYDAWLTHYRTTGEYIRLERSENEIRLKMTSALNESKRAMFEILKAGKEYTFVLELGNEEFFKREDFAVNLVDVRPGKALIRIFSSKPETAKQIVKAPDISVIMDVSDRNVKLGDTVEIKVKIKNQGNEEALNLRVTGEIPEGLDYITKPVWPNGKSIPPGGEEEITYEIKTKEVGTFTIEPVKVRFSDPRGKNYDIESEEVKITVTGEISVEAIKSADRHIIDEDGVVTIKNEIKNTGDITVTHIQIADSVPAGFVLVSGNLIHTFQEIKPGETKSYEYKLKGIKAGKYVLNASSLSYRDNLGRIRETKSNSIDIVVKSNPPEIKIYKTIQKNPIEVGGINLVTIKIENIGEGPASEIYVTDTIPPSLKLVEGQIEWRTDLLPPKSEKTFSYKVMPMEEGNITLPAAKIRCSDDEGNEYTALSSSIPLHVLPKEKPFLSRIIAFLKDISWILAGLVLALILGATALFLHEKQKTKKPRRRHTPRRYQFRR